MPIYTSSVNSDSNKDTKCIKNSSNNNSESGQYLENLTLTDKLNKRLLCSYLRRLNEKDIEAAKVKQEKSEIHDV